MEDFFLFDWSFIERFGDNPFYAMWFLFTRGGWVLFAYFFCWAVAVYFRGLKQMQYAKKREFIVLAIHVPRLHEQTPRAIENMFAYLAGAHKSFTKREVWLDGMTQDTISCELVSIDGHVQFLIRTVRYLRDLIEAAIYSQYPDAEIVEVEDYTLKVPDHYPNDEWDLWGTQYVPVKPDVYPIKTYPQFEDKVSGELKDPISAILEAMSRLDPGEQAWLQIVLTPIAQTAFHAAGETVIKKLRGEEVKTKKTLLDHATDVPLKTAGFVLDTVISGGGEGEKKKEEKNPFASKYFQMTKGEQEVIAGIENKISKIAFLTKIRFIYVAKKEIINKSRIAYSIIGFIKQFNTNTLQSLKPEFSRIGISSSLWLFKTRRNNARKNRLFAAYRGRSNWAGMSNFHLCTEELATLWHFPLTEQVKAPQLKKTESKRSEPPINLPFEQR